MAYKNWVVAPKNKKAIEQMYQAQYMFEKDSFNQALNNPGVGGTGFLKIITNYSGTESANLAKYYAGMDNLIMQSNIWKITNLLMTC